MAMVLLLLLFTSTQLAGAEKQPARSGHGFSYSHDDVPQKPWSIHIVRIDRTNSDFELDTTLGRGTQFGLGTLSSQVKSVPPALGRPVAAINGDYFRNGFPYAGDPKGLQITHGELVSAPSDWTCIWIDRAGAPHMTNVLAQFEAVWPNGEKIPFGLNEDRPWNGAVLYTSAVGASTRSRSGREFILERSGTNSWLPLRVGETYQANVREVRESGNAPLRNDIAVLSVGPQASGRLSNVAPGTTIRISTATLPDLQGAKTAIGGGPLLVRAGKVVVQNDGVRHPRSAVGWNDKFLFLLEVDGRQLNLSVGMTLPELASYMVKLGCTEAMSLDGGGSATCWVYGQVMNSPSEGRERPMANGLVLLHKDKK